MGLFYKNSLPVVVRSDLSFGESIVLELNFGRKRLFFTVLYRSPVFNHTSFEFQSFLLNFENLYSRIKAENPLAMFLQAINTAVNNAKFIYPTNLGNKVTEPNTSQKTYWKIINQIMNKCRAPKIPPLLVNNLLILISSVKARYFHDFFQNSLHLLTITVCYPFLTFLLIRGLIR